MAIWAIGNIGSADPTLVLNEIPFLIEYASNPERMTKEIMESAKESNPLSSSGFDAPFRTSIMHNSSIAIHNIDLNCTNHKMDHFTIMPVVSVFDRVVILYVLYLKLGIGKVT